MAKRLNVDLSFTADTSQAKAELQSLKTQLTELTNAGTANPQAMGLEREIQKATQSAAQLKLMLNEATDVNTGRLNLNTFTQSLQKSGLSLKDVQQQLHMLGSSGDQAFASLAKSIMSADVQLQKTHGILQQFATTLKNTARWQLSSTALHAFMGAIQTAYGYAQDLNESLNNIRIVTGQNADQMDKFASKANKAAQELSTSTLKYTDAALIFYQQGLDDKAVEERTNTTIKMANVTGDSAKEVSSYMTAIWNNFDDGSESLEHYADVITALGASTASSSSEIAEGLEKFAAVAETTGLSYDYATSALATLVANTRQSADTVGTSLKTIFSRLQGLQLGETLEDGTDLNKYSAALQKVGVEIKDASGNLRNMDDILDDLGARWQGLAKDEQMALAQTVAGVRQYNQLISLMNNWDDMKTNLQTAETADGTLQEQADIYAESWEGARERVKAAAEDIYKSLLDDKFFIRLTNGFAELLKGIKGIVDGLGGMRGVLGLVGTLVTKLFATELSRAFDNFHFSLQKIPSELGAITEGIKPLEKFSKKMTEIGEKKTPDLRQQATNLLVRQTADASGASASQQAQVDVYKGQAQSQQLLLDNTDRLSETELKITQQLMDQQAARGEDLVKATEAAEQAEHRLEIEREILKAMIEENLAGDANTEATTAMAEMETYAQDLEQISVAEQELIRLQGAEHTSVEELSQEYEKIIANVEEWVQEGKISSEVAEDFKAHTSEVSKALQGEDASVKKVQDAIGALTKKTKVSSQYTAKFAQSQLKLENALKKSNKTRKNASDTAKKYGEITLDAAGKTKQADQANRNYASSTANVSKYVASAVGHISTFGDVMTASMRAVSSYAMAVNSIKSLSETLRSDASAGEKLLAVITTLSMSVPMFASSMLNLGKTVVATTGFSRAFALAQLENQGIIKGSTLLSKEMEAQELKELLAKALKIDTTKLESAEELNAALSKKLGVVISEDMTAAEIVEAVAKGANTIATHLLAMANIELESTMSPVLVVTLLLVAALLVLTAIIVGVIAAVKAYNENSPEGKLAALKAEVDETGEALKTVKDHADEVNESLNKLADKYHTLSTLKKGSVEWAQAVADINAEVANLREEYEGLDEFLERDKDGVWQFKEGAGDFIRNQEANKVATATNLHYKAKNKYNEQRIENNRSNFTEDFTTAVDDDGSNIYASDIKGVLNKIQDGYNNSLDFWGTEVEKLYNNLDQKTLTYLEHNGIYSLDDFSKWLKENEEILKENSRLAEEINENSKELLINHLATTGTTRTADEVTDLLGEDAYDKAYAQARTNAQQKFRDAGGDGFHLKPGIEGWQEHTNYTDSDEEMQYLNQYKKLKGLDNYEYVAQRNGYAVFEDENGKQHKASAEDVWGTIAEANVGEELRTMLADQVKTSLKDAANDISDADWDALGKGVKDGYLKAIDGAKEDTLIAIDNFNREVADSLTSSFMDEGVSEEDAKKKAEAFAQKTTATAVTALAPTKDDGSVDMEAGVEKYRELTAFVDTNSQAFINNAKALQENKISTDEYLHTLNELNEAGKITAQSEWFQQQADASGMGSDAGAEMQEYASYLMEIADTADDVADSLDEDAQMAAKLSVQISRMNKGVEDLSEGFDDWSDVLKKSKKSSVEYMNALKKMKTAVANVLDVEEDMVTDDFVHKHMDLIKKAADGDAEAIDELHKEMAKEVLTTIKANLDDEDAKKKLTELENNIQGFFDKYKDLEIGASIDDAEFLKTANDMRTTAGMTVKDVNDYFGEMGYEPQYAVTDIENANSVEEPNADTEIALTSIGTSAEENISVAGVDLPISAPAITISTRSIPKDPTDTGGDVTLTSWTGDPNKPAPEIKGFKKKATGKMNNGSKDNAGGNNKGKKSGGGGGNKSKNHADKKKVKDESDRYHVIKKTLEELSATYDKLSKAKDRAWGPARIKALQAELKAQQNITAANKEYLNQIKKNLNTDKADLKKYGAQIDKNGVVSNYDNLIKQEVQRYNDAVNAYNGTDSEDEAAKAAFEAAEKRYEDFKKSLEQYEETRALYNEQLQQTIDDANAEHDLKLDIIQTEVELKVTIADSSIKYFEYLLNHMEHTAYDIAAAFDAIGGSTEATVHKIEAAEKGIKDILKEAGLSDDEVEGYISGDAKAIAKVQGLIENGTIQDNDMQALQGYMDDILTGSEELEELRQKAHDQLIEQWDIWNEKIDKGIAKLEHLAQMTEHYGNIVDLVGKKNLFQNTEQAEEFMAKLRQTTLKVAQDKLESEQKRLAAARSALTSAENALQHAYDIGASDETIKDLEDNVAKIKEDIQGYEESSADALENVLQTINDIYTAQIEDICNNYSAAVAGLAGSLENLQAQFDRKQKLNEQYLEDYEKIYQLSKLTREVSKSIDETSNIKAKNELAKIQQKIVDKQKEGVKVSQYEMDYLQKEFELKKAQIALEEAQQAKSQVQLTRDSEGNYGYVYTANQDDVAKAQQTYEDKLYDMQKANAEYVNNLQSQIIELEQEYASAIEEIMNDSELSDEERNARLEEWRAYYKSQMDYYMSEMGKWETNSQELYENDWKTYAEKTDYKISTEDNWLDHFSETPIALLTGYDTAEKYQANHNEAEQNLLTASATAHDNWRKAVKDALEAAGLDMGDYAKTAGDKLDEIKTQSDATKTQIETDANNMATAINDIATAIMNWDTQYDTTVDKMLEKNKKLRESFNKLLKSWENYNDSQNDNSGDGKDKNNNGGKDSNDTNDGKDNKLTDEIIDGIAGAIWYWSPSAWGNGSERKRKINEKFGAGAYDKVQSYINKHVSGSNLVNGGFKYGWSKRDKYKDYYYSKFDTGGYTGEWGADGKFAMLHQKELVLNEQDTSNFLAAVDMVRQIANAIDLNALSAAGGFSSMLAATVTNSEQALQQEVTIHAEFPNATDRNEISAAFNELVNLASQYANRTNK